MGKYLRYTGEFLSHKGVTWRAEVMQEADSAFSSIGQLTFEADEAIVIEYNKTEKEDVIHGSTATLRIESPSDRKYEDLYTVEAGAIRLDIYNNGSLYWSGALDPEFYEEPYEKEKYYTVTLTFSDLGILSRLKFGLSGLLTLQEILSDALSRSAIKYLSINEDYISTLFTDGEQISLDSLSVRSDNFFNEDGEAETLEDTVAGMLQPLGLHMVQRNGKIFIFDLNGLHKGGEQRSIEWDGDSQIMGTDKVINNVKINFSPYASATLLEDILEYTGEYSDDKINLSDTGEYSDGTEDTDGTEDDVMYTFLPSQSSENRHNGTWDVLLANFNLFLSKKGKGLEYLSSKARYFHITPLVGGPSECSGVAWCFSSWASRHLNAVSPCSENSAALMFRAKKVFIPKLSNDVRKSYYLKLSLEILLDPRYNPFVDTDDGNFKSNYNTFKEFTGWAFVPVALTLYDASGSAVSHFVNRPRTMSGAQGVFYWSIGGCSWEDGAASFGDCWLAYYNTGDQEHDTGILGWKKNRQNIGRPDIKSRRQAGIEADCYPDKGDEAEGDFEIYSSFSSIPDGEFIPYPETGGWLEVSVFEGVQCFDKKEESNFWATKEWTARSCYDKVRWLLFKAPTVDIVKGNLTFDDAELDDVEYSGYINKSAKDELSIDTICGTADNAGPTARGIYHRTSDGLQIGELTREGVTDHPERLLIGTLCSQYGERHTTLQGDAVIDTGDLCVFSEQNQTGKVFIISEETQDLISDVTEALYTELSGDEYEAIEEVEE